LIDDFKDNTILQKENRLISNLDFSIQAALVIRFVSWSKSDLGITIISLF
jgi:hypothetical protein